MSKQPTRTGSRSGNVTMMKVGEEKQGTNIYDHVFSVKQYRLLII